MKMSEYPAVGNMEMDDILLIDGVNGTKRISKSNFRRSMFQLHDGQMGNYIAKRQNYGGFNLGTSVSADQLAAIRDGSFRNMWIGDYWVINGTTYRIMDFNYWLMTGENTPLTTKHVVLMPDRLMYKSPMNSTDTTSGGYAGSQMRTTNLNAAKNTINADFPGMVISRRSRFSNAVTNGVVSGSGWYDSTVDLPNEYMIYGVPINQSMGSGTAVRYMYETDNQQLALPKLDRQYINISREEYWLRDTAGNLLFSVAAGAFSYCTMASSTAIGVRPVFAIG